MAGKACSRCSLPSPYKCASSTKWPSSHATSRENPSCKPPKSSGNTFFCWPERTKKVLKGALANWHTKWETFLNERTKDAATGKSRYTHRRLRSAYRSLKTNLPWLFTWYDNPTLNIPNTTNAIDGHFADLKNKLRNHNGLSLQRKKKFIDEFLKA